MAFYVKNEVLPQVKATAPFKVSAPPIPSQLMFQNLMSESLLMNDGYYDAVACEEQRIKNIEEQFSPAIMHYRGWSHDKYDIEHPEENEEGAKQYLIALGIGACAAVAVEIGAIEAASSLATAFGSMVTTTENVMVSPGGTAVLGNSVTNVQVTAEAQVFVTEGAYAVAANGNVIIDAMTGMGGGGPEGTGETGYSAPDGGGGITSEIKVGNDVVTFGHGARHLNGTGLSSQEVNEAIANEIVNIHKGVGELYKGTIEIKGILIEYTAFGVKEGVINVGTYYPLPY